jgi:chromosome segregation ATPase
MSDRELEAQLAFLRKRVELERESFTAERERYELEIVQYAAEIRKLKSENYSSRVKISDLEVLLGDVHKLKAIAAEYEALGGASLLDRFQDLVAKCRGLEMDNGILQAFRDKDEERIVQLESHNSELSRKLSGMDDYHQMKRDLAAANAKLLQLSGDSSSHDVVVSSLHEDYLRLQREFSSLQIELLMEKKKSERLLVTVEVLELDLKRSDQNVNSLAPDLEIMKFEAEGYKQKAAEAIIRADNELWLHEETRSHLQRVESTATQLEVQVGVLALQCESLQESLDKIVVENTSLRDQLRSRTEALDTLVDEREKLMLELADVYAIGSVQDVIQKARETMAAQLELSNIRVALHGLY